MFFDFIHADAGVVVRHCRMTVQSAIMIVMAEQQAGKKELVLNGVVVGEVEMTGDFEKDAELAMQFLKDKGLHKVASPEKVMFRQAVSFATTAAYLHKTDFVRRPWNPFSVAPFVVNSAFSIELYLKTLGKIYNKIMKGHDLLVLFDSLPQDAHTQITSLPSESLAGFVPAGNPALRVCISELSGAFVEWRYLHEKKRATTIRPDRMIFVMKVLHEACLGTRAISA
jgi:hypothetical protein